MNFLHHLNVSVECLSDSLQQILKYDNGALKTFPSSSSFFFFPFLKQCFVTTGLGLLKTQTYFFKKRLKIKVKKIQNL